MGALLSNLGIMAEYEGDFGRSRALHEEGLAYRMEVGEKGAIAISLMNLGNVLLLQGHPDEARARQEESLQLRRETGDPWMIAIGEHNLGILTRSQGDYEHDAEACSRRRCTCSSEHGDKWALPFMLEDIAVLAALEGDPATASGSRAQALPCATRRARHVAKPTRRSSTPLLPRRGMHLAEQGAAAWERGRAEGLDSAIDAALAYLAAAPIRA